MSNISKEFLRNYIMEQNFTDSNHVLESLKEPFKDVLQEVLAAETR